MIKCIVIVCDKGRPRLIPVEVECSDEEREQGDHYEAAKDYVRRAFQLSGPYVVFDEDDAWFTSFDWDQVPTIDASGATI